MTNQGFFEVPYSMPHLDNVIIKAAINYLVVIPAQTGIQYVRQTWG